MWLSRRELARLERELKNALQRAAEAEHRLDAERQAKDWLTLQLSSRLVTKTGGYGLDHEMPKSAAATPHPRNYTHEPSDIDYAKLEYYKQCAANVGRSEEDAVQRWEAEMRGEMITYTEGDN